MTRKRTKTHPLGYAVTGTLLAVGLSGCGIVPAGTTRVATPSDTPKDVYFADERQAASFHALLAEARAEVAASEAKTATQTTAPTRKKERRAARTTRQPPAASAAAREEKARAEALALAEAAVMEAPLEAAPRIALAQAYLAAGRFSSAAAGFSDAAALADSAAPLALQHVLALIGAGDMAAASDLLNQYQADIPVADLGLAIALSGQTDRAIAVLSDAIRAGEGNARLRQNLAYSYALANRWRHARVMAAQDVPPDQINQRIEEWSRTAHPAAGSERIAALLNAPAHVYDRGMPLHLALGNFLDSADFAEAAFDDAPDLNAGVTSEIQAPKMIAAAFVPPPVAMVPAEPQDALVLDAGLLGRAETAVVAALDTAPPETPAPSVAAPLPRATAFMAAYAPDIPERAFAAEPAASPSLAPAQISAPSPAEQASKAPSQPLAASRTRAGHSVQLGSFLTEHDARQALRAYQSRYSSLKDRELIVSEALVRGKRYFRVTATGYSAAASRALCNEARAGGEGCLTTASALPLGGSVARGRRFVRV